MVSNPPLSVTLRTTLALVDHYSAALQEQPTTAFRVHSASETTNSPPSPPSPFALLSASALWLKPQVAKLSLLTITPPFTPSAVSSILISLHESILPSLVTAVSLLTATEYTATFSREARTVVHATLQDLRSLIVLIEARDADGKPREVLTGKAKESVTGVTGRLWKECDELSTLVEGGGIGHCIYRKAEQWLELITDAVKELEEWNPADDEDELADMFGDGDYDESGGDLETEDIEKDAEEVTEKQRQLAQAKEFHLGVLMKIPQSVDVVVRQTLSRPPLPEKLCETQVRFLDGLIEELRRISGSVDEAIEYLYSGKVTLSWQCVQTAKNSTIALVEAVPDPSWAPRSVRTE